MEFIEQIDWLAYKYVLQQYKVSMGFMLNIQIFHYVHD